MPAPATNTDFLDIVRRSNLVEPDRLAAFLSARPYTTETPADLARILTGNGLLTGFQAEQLLKGRHRGFVIGKYKLLDRIGVGGMGQVYLAEHTGMGRRAAVKVLPPDMAESSFARERFLREARAVGRLDHPNLVRAFDVDTDGDVIFLVMEYVDGVNLHEMVIRSGPLDPARVGDYLWQAANGLAYIHSAGMIHRDIKPANLMVDRAGTVKITDLGLVRSQLDGNELTRGQGVSFLGTADFLAPEQAIDCSTVDGRADLYSLGATGYFLLTGKMPYPADTVAQKLIAHQTRPVPRATDIRPGVPADLSATLVRLMAKRPEDRFQSPAELLTALARWADAAPTPPTDREFTAPAGVSSPTPRPWAASSATPARRTTASSDSLRPVSPPATAAARRGGVAVAEAPPVLPAVRTHTLTADPASKVRPAVVNPFHPTAKSAAPAAQPAAVRRRVSMAFACGLTLAVAAWDVVLLAGPSVAPPTGVSKEATKKIAPAPPPKPRG